VIRWGNPPVTVAVPASLRDDVRITWGNEGQQGPSLRFAARPSYGRPLWHAYAGGFLLRRRAICVPLVFRVGGRNAVVRFGIGMRCS